MRSVIPDSKVSQQSELCPPNTWHAISTRTTVSQFISSALQANTNCFVNNVQQKRKSWPDSKDKDNHDDNVKPQPRGRQNSLSLSRRAQMGGSSTKWAPFSWWARKSSRTNISVPHSEICIYEWFERWIRSSMTEARQPILLLNPTIHFLLFAMRNWSKEISFSCTK